MKRLNPCFLKVHGRCESSKYIGSHRLEDRVCNTFAGQTRPRPLRACALRPISTCRRHRELRPVRDADSLRDMKYRTRKEINVEESSQREGFFPVSPAITGARGMILPMRMKIQGTCSCGDACVPATSRPRSPFMIDMVHTVEVVIYTTKRVVRLGVKLRCVEVHPFPLKSNYISHHQ